MTQNSVMQARAADPAPTQDPEDAADYGGDETETMFLIQKYLTPVRYNRKYPIHLHPKKNRDFMYRVA